jgi:putative restriction endonuclease
MCRVTFPGGPQDFESRVRSEGMAWLERRTRGGAEVVSGEDLADFAVDGRPVRLMDAQRGIWKPRIFEAALSIRTTYRAPGQARPYEDNQGPDGLLRYKWRGLDPQQADNRALRRAMQLAVPLIWFYGVGAALYRPLFPVYVIHEEPDEQQFIIDLDVVREFEDLDSPMEAQLRKYVVRETRQRLHQPVFRATVLRAYQIRCAVCSLGHAELLDAAHIVGDREEAGIPVVNNGMALCKIHHAAYDRRILGVRPDLVVEIRADLLAEIDGPMLRYGLQERHGQPLMTVPRRKAERPDRALLEMSYAAFRSEADAGI